MNINFIKHSKREHNVRIWKAGKHLKIMQRGELVKLEPLGKLSGTFTDARNSSVQSLLEIHHSGEQVIQVESRKLPISAILSKRKCQKKNGNREHWIPMIATAAILSFEHFITPDMDWTTRSWEQSCLGIRTQAPGFEDL